jgi:hypothetical protein
LGASSTSGRISCEEWARRLADRQGVLIAAGVVEAPEQELERLRRETGRPKEEQSILFQRLVRV